MLRIAWQWHRSGNFYDYSFGGFQTATCLQPKGAFNCPIAASRHSFIPQEEVYSKAMHNAPSKGQLCA